MRLVRIGKKAITTIPTTFIGIVFWELLVRPDDGPTPLLLGIFFILGLILPIVYDVIVTVAQSLKEKKA